MKVLFYGRLADAFGPEVEIDAPAGWSIAQVRERLANEHSTALIGKRVLACVAGALVREDYVIGEGDQVEFLPPVSGG